jgi:hypothetical protein
MCFYEERIIYHTVISVPSYTGHSKIGMSSTGSSNVPSAPCVPMVLLLPIEYFLIQLEQNHFELESCLWHLIAQSLLNVSKENAKNSLLGLNPFQITE